MSLLKFVCRRRPHSSLTLLNSSLTMLPHHLPPRRS